MDITKAPIRLRGCTNWSAHLMFASQLHVSQVFLSNKIVMSIFDFWESISEVSSIFDFQDSISEVSSIFAIQFQKLVRFTIFKIQFQKSV